MLGNNHDVWYVRASFGTEWGPISASTLLEMAESGSLANDDLARSDRDDEWFPIQQAIDHLHGLITLSESKSIEDSFSEANDDRHDIATVDSPTIELHQDQGGIADSSMMTSASPRKARLGALPGWSNYWTPESSQPSSSSSGLQIESAPETSFDEGTGTTDDSFHDGHFEEQIDASLDERQDEDGLDSTEDDNLLNSKDDQFALLETWKRQRTERINRLLKIVADREVAEKNIAERRAAEVASSEVSTRQTSLTAESDDGQMRSAIESLPPGEIRRPKIEQESWEQTLIRWKRSLPSQRVVVVALLLVCGAWWYWPESYGDVFETFREMYDKLERLRELENDKTGMEEFVQTSQARLSKIVPVLENRSTPNRPESQWLLWMGRDCLVPMLKNPRLRDTKPEVTFRKLLAEWDRKYNPVAPTKNAASTNAPSGKDAESIEPQQDTAKPANRATRQPKVAEESVNDR